MWLEKTFNWGIIAFSIDVLKKQHKRKHAAKAADDCRAFIFRCCVWHFQFAGSTKFTAQPFTDHKLFGVIALAKPRHVPIHQHHLCTVHLDEIITITGPVLWLSFPLWKATLNESNDENTWETHRFVSTEPYCIVVQRPSLIAVSMQTWRQRSEWKNRSSYKQSQLISFTWQQKSFWQPSGCAWCGPGWWGHICGYLVYSVG